MYRIEEDVKSEIEKAIEEVERHTSCELVAVVSQRSDTYIFIPLLWASVIALFFPMVCLFFCHGLGYLQVYQIQVLLFVVFATLFSMYSVKKYLIPKSVAHRRASQKAREGFMTLGLHRTKRREAVMLFVSLDEKYVEIVVDKGVRDKIPNSDWHTIVSRFIDDVHHGEFGRGYLKAIKACQALLEEHFPHNKGDKDIFPNHLIEI